VRCCGRLIVRFASVDAPEAAGFDLALRGLSMIESDDRVLELTGPVFDCADEFFRREMLLGREPA
jgi:hypothetical protein